MTRIFSNYLRMIITFAIGFYLIKRLLAYDIGAYSIYALVVIGFGIGVMIREALRIFLVSRISEDLKDSGTHLRDGFYLCAIGAAFNIGMAIMLALSADLFSLPSGYSDNYIWFVIFRSLGVSVLIYLTPMLNILAYRGEMVKYNVILIVERLLDLLLVEAAILLHDAEMNVVSFGYGGAIYFVASILLYGLLVLFFTDSKFKRCLLTPARQPSVGRLGSSFKGSLLLVLNNAFSMRAPILVINIFIGETASALFAIAIQIAGYVRQGCMGLVTGLDSMFRKKLLTTEGGIVNAEMNQKLLIVAFTVMAISVVFVYHVDILLSFLLPNKLENDSEVILISRVLIVYMMIRMSTEVWTQLLAAVGGLMQFSYLSILVNSLIVVVIVILAEFDMLNPTIWVAVFILLTAVVINLAVYPKVLVNLKIYTDYRKVILLPLIPFSFFIPHIYCGFYGIGISKLVFVFELLVIGILYFNHRHILGKVLNW